MLPVSFFERANAAHFNSLAMIDADGRVLGVYRKSHIPDGPGCAAGRRRVRGAVVCVCGNRNQLPKRFTLSRHTLPLTPTHLLPHLATTTNTTNTQSPTQSPTQYHHNDTNNKQNSYQEKFYFSPGDTGFKVFDTAYGRLGAGICWDQWFPECARAMALMGAEVRRRFGGWQSQ